MRPVARALAALLVIGTFVVPYAQPLLCSAQTVPTAAEHGQHSEHGRAGGHGAANLLGTPGHAVMCHGAPACGMSHVAPLRGSLTILPAPQQADRAAIESVWGLSAVLAATSPPPKR